MALSTYGTTFFAGLVPFLKLTPSWLIDTFFPRTMNSTAEQIAFDMVTNKRRLAPFVHPASQGKIMNPTGFVTNFFKPAYVKPKMPVNFERTLTRLPGEPLLGAMSPQQRKDLIIMTYQQEQIEMIRRRKEVMASEALRLGRVTVVGELYPSTVVNFNRDAALTVTLSGGSRWTQNGSTPLKDLDTWAQLVFSKSGSYPIRVAMDPVTWPIFRDHIDVKERMTIVRQANSDLSLDLNQGVNPKGAVKMGVIGSFEIWVYMGEYEDENGATQKVLPDYTVLMVGDIEGVQAHGAIKDIESLEAVDYYTKYWEEKDPGVGMLMTQSAPLIVTAQPNGSLCATVN